MKRQCFIYKSSETYDRHICIDVDLAEEILGYVNQNDKYRKKFDYIMGRILEQNWMYYEDYSPLDIGDLTEMRFFPNNDNGRIYCREVSFGKTKLCVVAIKVLPKKKPSGKIDKTIKQTLKPLLDYEYELAG